MRRADHGGSAAAGVVAVCVAAAMLAAAPSAHAQAGPALSAFEVLSDGLDADEEFTAFALSPVDGRAYVGTADGTLYTSVDGSPWVPAELDVDPPLFPDLPTRRDVVAFDAPYPLDNPLLARPSSVLNRSTVLQSEAYRGSFDVAHLSNLGADGFVRDYFDDLQRFERHGLQLDLEFGIAARSVAPLRVNWIAAHPQVEGTALAATSEGTFRTEDGGLTWYRVHWDGSAQRRDGNHVAWSPHDPARVVLCTRGGVVFSSDGGRRFVPAADARFARSAVAAMAFDPRNPDTEYFAMGIVRSRSVTRATSDFLLWGFPRMGAPSAVVFDPHDPAVVIVASDNGLWRSDDAGGGMERAGGPLFSGVDVRSLDVAASGRRFVAATEHDVWESPDGGATWQAVRFGAYDGDVRRALFDPVDPDRIWVVGRHQIVRSRPAGVVALSPQGERAWTAWLDAQPSLDEAIDAALRRIRHREADLERYARRARGADWMPRLDVTVLHAAPRADATTSALGFAGPGELFDAFGATYDAPSTEWRVFASWDVMDAVAGVEERAIRVRSVALRRAQLDRVEEVARLYTERARLVFQELAATSDDSRARTMRSLRLREVEAHLNYLTDGLLTPS